MQWWDWMPWSSFLEYWVLIHLFTLFHLHQKREESSGWGIHVYLWQIHFDIWQNQYNILKLNKIKLKKNNKNSVSKKKKKAFSFLFTFCHQGGVICLSEVVNMSPGNPYSSCDSSSLAFHTIYSAYKLNKQVTIFSLDILLSQFWTNPLFHVWF